MITISFEEAQSRFDRLLDTVEREPVAITRNGRTAAFLVSPQDMRVLQDARGRRVEAVEALEAYFAQADAKLAPAARELTDADVVKLVRELR